MEVIGIDKWSVNIQQSTKIVYNLLFSALAFWNKPLWTVDGTSLILNVTRMATLPANSIRMPSTAWPREYPSEKKALLVKNDGSLKLKFDYFFPVTTELVSSAATTLPATWWCPVTISGEGNPGAITIWECFPGTRPTKSPPCHTT